MNRYFIRGLPRPGKYPLNTLAKPTRDPEQRFAADLADALFVTRELSLADSQLARKVRLLHVKPAKLSQPAADSIPVNVNGFALGTRRRHHG